MKPDNDAVVLKAAIWTDCRLLAMRSLFGCHRDVASHAIVVVDHAPVGKQLTKS